MSVNINKETEEEKAKACENCGKAHDSEECCYDFLHSAQKFFDEASKNAEDTTTDFEKADIETAKPFAALAYLNVLFFLPLVVVPNSRFGKFHANQALVLLIFHVVLATAFALSLSLFQSLTPEFLGFLDRFLDVVKTLPSIASFVFMLIGIVNAAQGKAKELPFIGKIKLISV